MPNDEFDVADGARSATWVRRNKPSINVLALTDAAINVPINAIVKVSGSEARYRTKVDNPFMLSPTSAHSSLAISALSVGMWIKRVADQGSRFYV